MKPKRAKPTKDRDSMLPTVAAIASLAEIFCDTQADKNAWKKQMLNAGLDTQGLNFPADWDKLPEAEKQRRLDGAIAELKKVSD